MYSANTDTPIQIHRNIPTMPTMPTMQNNACPPSRTVKPSGAIQTKTKTQALPAGMRARHRPSGTYYYLDTGGRPRKEISLGKDLSIALQQWHALTLHPLPSHAQITFRDVAERYCKDVLPHKAVRTQQDNQRELAKLYQFFDNPPSPLEQINPIHIRQYLDWRSAAKVRANREKALFSHIWNYAREKGHTHRDNPCRGIRGYKEHGRDIYIDDNVLQAVYQQAEPALQDALDLAYLTGQRPADLLKLSTGDIKDGALWIKQNKSGAKLRITIEGQLANVLQRIQQRQAEQTHSNRHQHLLQHSNGQAMTPAMLRGAFTRARNAASTANSENPALQQQINAFQFRDLRAKAGTDKEESQGINAAQAQLGHTTATMTQHYVRHRKGKLVSPTR